MRTSIGSHWFVVLIVLCSSGCVPSSVTVPIQDPMTPPAATLDIGFSQGRIYTVTSAGYNPTLPAQLGGSDEIALIAKCTDEDGGCQNVQIFVDGTAYNPDGSFVVMGLSTPFAESRDTTATPGGTANKERLVSNKLDIRQLRGSFAAVQVNVSARAINVHQGKDNTKQVTLYWSQQVPLVLPPCPRFTPIGSASPVVLDSRQLSIGVQDAKTRDPNKQIFIIAVADRDPNAKNWWRVTVEEVGLAPTMAVFRLEDLTGAEKEATTVDSRNCNTAGKLMKATANSTSLDVLVTNADTSTLILSADMQDVAVWNEATFWQAFGGRRTTFTWVTHSP